MSAHTGPAPVAWVRHAVLWHVYPLGFLGAPAEAQPQAEPAPRLRGLVGWLDYLVELGANGLLLGPVFESESHGYDTTNYLEIDSRLGTEADLDHLVDQAHHRGIRVVLDGVFNHVGRSFAPYADAVAQGKQSPYYEWFRWDRDGHPAVFEGHQHLVALNHENPAVADYVTGVMQHWVERGIDGWRLDAAYAVPHTFWAEVCGRLRANHPDVWLLGEVIHGDYAAFAHESGVDSVTQYELWKAIWSALNDRNLFELSHALQRHDELLDDLVPQTFVGNHDVTRIASRLEEPRHLPHALAVLFTLAGVPSIYAGDERGLTGTKEERAGGDDAIRQPFPSSPHELDPAGDDMLRLHQTLIAMRRRHPWLHRAHITVEHLSNTEILYRCRAGTSEQLLVALNLADQPVTLHAAHDSWAPEVGRVLVAGNRLDVPPHGWGVLRSTSG